MLYGKYNTQTDFYFTINKASDGWTGALAASGDWTPATGDTKISKDGGAVANTTNNPTALSGTGSVIWKLTLTNTEMSAASCVIQIVDSITKSVEDKTIEIYTYGHASAKIAEDISDANFQADQLLNRDMSAGTDTNARSPRNALRLLRNKWAVTGLTLSVKKEDDSTEAWNSTLTTSTEASGVTSSDPS